MASCQISGDSNQCSRWPSSSRVVPAPRPTIIPAIPSQSAFRSSLQSQGVLFIPIISMTIWSPQTGTLMKKA